MFQLQLSSLNCKGSPNCTAYATTSSASMDSGYPLDWFAETVENELVCEICGKVLHFPRATPCGHIFCLRCAEFWIEYYGICPKRCGEIDMDGLRKEPRVEKRIMSLYVNCKYSVYGCKTQPTLADKQKHEKKCLFKSKADKIPIHSFSLAADSSTSHDTYVEMASVAGNRKAIDTSRANLHLTTTSTTVATPELVSHTHTHIRLANLCKHCLYYC